MDGWCGDGVVGFINMLGGTALTEKTTKYAQENYGATSLTSAFLSRFSPAKSETKPTEILALPQVSALSNNLSTFIIEDYQK